MRGMGQLVTTSFGQYPQFLPQTFGMGDYIVAKPGFFPQFITPSGMGDYLSAKTGVYPQFLNGMGCCGCDGMNGLTMDGTGLFGTGLFAGGTDLSTWGAGEWGVVVISAYMLFSTFSTTKRGVSRVVHGPRRDSRRK